MGARQVGGKKAGMRSIQIGNRAPQDMSGSTSIVVNRSRRFSRGSGGQDARYGAAEAHEHGDEALAVQPEAMHEPVDEEGRPRHVARVLQEGEAEEEEDDVGEEDDDAADAANDPIDEQGAQGRVGLGRPQSRDPASEGLEALLEPAHGDLAHREGEPEDGEHDREEDRDAEESVNEHAVHAVRGLAGAAAPGADEHLAQQAVHEAAVATGDEQREVAALGCLDRLPLPGGDVEGPLPILAQRADLLFEGALAGEQLARDPAPLALLDPDLGQRLLDGCERALEAVAEDERAAAAHGVVGGGREPLLELPESLAAVAHRLDDGEAEQLGEAGDVHPLARQPRLVGHVEAEHGVGIDVHDLGEEDERPGQVARIDDHGDDVEVSAEQLVLRHALLRRERAQGVAAGQVDDVVAAPVVAVAPLALLDRHAGVVAHPLAATGQAVEHGRLAGVGLPGDGDADAFFPLSRHLRPGVPDMDGLGLRETQGELEAADAHPDGVAGRRHPFDMDVHVG